MELNVHNKVILMYCLLAAPALLELNLEYKYSQAMERYSLHNINNLYLMYQNLFQ